MITAITIPAIIPGETEVPLDPVPAVFPFFPIKGLPVVIRFTESPKFGIDPKRLLFETSRTLSVVMLVKASGMEPIKLLLSRYKFLNDVNFAKTGEIVPTNCCLAKLIVMILPCESQIMKVQPVQALFPVEELASMIGYPNAEAISSNVVTWGS